MQEPTVFKCNINTKITCVGEPPEDENDPGLPEGWVTVIARRKVRNPEYVKVVEALEAFLELQSSGLREQGAPEALIARSEYLAQAQTPIPPEFLVQEVVAHYSPGNAAALQDQLFMEDWEGESEE